MKKSECRFIRARQPEQKELRRTQILESAAYLLERDGFEKVSLNGIARQTRIAKSNIYRYFESREDIYLQLLQEDWIAWVDKIEDELRPLHGSDDIEQVATIVSDAVLDAPRMCQLVSVLGSVLENNISDELLYNFKLETVNLGMRLVAMINATLPGIKQQALLPAIQSIIALIAGLWPLGNPSEQVEKVMEKPELKPFKMEFATAFKQSLLLIIKGAYS